jgi:nicotinate-nucleotide adenylyltransferase
MRVGLFGGTFDPVHEGHLDVARTARRAIGLDAVWLVPSRLPPHREAPRASAAHRFAMAALAVQDQEGILVSDLEMDATGPSYTSDTLRRLEARGIDLRFVAFVIGADAFREIEIWKDYPAVLDRCHFLVVSRPEAPAPRLRDELPELSGRMLDAPCALPARPSILLLDATTPPVSSTDVRQAIAKGTPLDGLLPVSVADHISRHGLYRSAPPIRQVVQGTA